MYRPDNWECPYKPDGENEEWYGDIGARDQSIYEAGADAMLVGLQPYFDKVLNLCKLLEDHFPEEQVKKDK